MSDSYYVKMDHYSDKTESSITYEVDADVFLKVAKAVTNYDEDDSDYNPMEEIDRLRYQISCYEKQIKEISQMFQGKGDWYDKN